MKVRQHKERELLKVLLLISPLGGLSLRVQGKGRVLFKGVRWCVLIRVIIGRPSGACVDNMVVCVIRAKTHVRLH